MDNQKKLSKGNAVALLVELGKTWPTIVGNILHTLCTKLATLQMKEPLLQEVFPILLKGYRLAIEQKLMEPEIQERTIRLMHDAINLDAQVTPMLELLNSFNSYCGQLRLGPSGTRLLSARDYVEELLASYPFENDVQRRLVQLDLGDDFKFNCTPLFIDTLLKTLLTQAIERTKIVKQGVINIWLSKNKGYNELNFKDNNCILSAYECEHIFEQALISNNDKYLPGIGLCRLVMQQLGGDVICNVNPDVKYTHYKILFQIV